MAVHGRFRISKVFKGAMFLKCVCLIAQSTRIKAANLEFRRCGMTMVTMFSVLIIIANINNA